MICKKQGAKLFTKSKEFLGWAKWTRGGKQAETERRTGHSGKAADFISAPFRSSATEKTTLSD